MLQLHNSINVRQIKTQGIMQSKCMHSQKLTLCELQLLFAFAGCSDEHEGSAAALLQATGSREHTTNEDGESLLSKFILVLSCWQTLRATSLPQLGK